MPVFEITGAEFTNSDVHTASSISIRFPRITKIRDDKSPKQATNLEELIHLYEESKAGIHLDELNKLKNTESDESKDKVTASIFTKVASSISTDKKRKSADLEDEEEGEVIKKIKTEDKNLPGDIKEESSEASVDKKEYKDESNAKSKSRESNRDDMKRKNDSETLESAVKKPKVGDLTFKDFLLFRTEGVKEKYRSEIREFEKLGGKITSDSKKANLVLHDAKEIESSADKLRKLYCTNCRHHQVTWLKESLKNQKLQNPLHYFVKLHQI